MSLEIKQRDRDGVQILDLRGRLTLGVETAQLHEKIGELVGLGNKLVLLNLESIGYIDSSGLGTLIQCYTTLRNAKGSLKLLKVSESHTKLLVVTKLSTVFEVFSDELEAVNSFFPGGVVRPARKKRVMIFGGGIGGLSAAQELAERGFEVAIYEASTVFGGKARSIQTQPVG